MSRGDIARLTPPEDSAGLVEIVAIAIRAADDPECEIAWRDEPDKCRWLWLAENALAATAKAYSLDDTDCRWLGSVILVERAKFERKRNCPIGAETCESAGALMVSLAEVVEDSR